MATSSWTGLASNLISTLIVPLILAILYSLDIITVLSLKILAIISLVLFVGLPIAYKFSYNLQRATVFLNSVQSPKGGYDHPIDFGLEGTRNFYLISDENVKLGVWQILPEKFVGWSNRTDDKYFEDVLANGLNTILYIHGNSGSRAINHRVELYKVLRKYFNIITFDYRGYADSSSIEPTEFGVAEDCMFMIKWVRSKIAPHSHMFVWGHSLGSSVTLLAASLLNKENVIPTGIILESPFNNMMEEMSGFPLTLLFRHLPWFRYTIVEPVHANGFRFESDKYIKDVYSPILILHAEDDRVVPYELGRKLFKAGLKDRKKNQGSILFHTFDRKYNYGHKYIYEAPNINDIVQNFINIAIDERQILKIH